MARRGLTINMDAFAGRMIDADMCALPQCTHGEGMIPIAPLIEKALAERTPTYYCRLLSSHRIGSHPELTGFHHLRTSVYYVHDDPTGPHGLLDNASFKWFPAWDEILLPHPLGVNLEKFNDAWLRNEIKVHEEKLYEKFLNNLEVEGNWKLPRGSLDKSKLVLVHSIEGRPVPDGEVFREEYFGRSGMPRVTIVPEACMQVLPFQEARGKHPGWDFFSLQHFTQADGTIWFLGDQACFEPVPLLEKYTPEARETAGVLLENLSLKEALEAACNV